MRKYPIKITAILFSFFCLLSLTPIQAASTKLKVTAELANVRLKPSIGSMIIRQFPQGAILESVSKEGEWYLVKLEPDEEGNVSGYVHESLVLAVSGAPQESEIRQKAEIKKREEPQEPVTSEKAQTEAPSEQLAAGQFSIGLTAGANYAASGDLNEGAKGLADYYSEDLGIKKEEKQGEVAPFHLSFVVGGEISFPLSPKFVLSAGADFFQGKRESLVKYQKAASLYKFTARPEVQAVPIKLSLSYYPFSVLYFKMGIAYYFAQCRYYYRFEHDQTWEEWQGEAKAQGIGFNGAVGYEWSFGSNLALFLELSSQYALIKGFKGKDMNKDSTSNETVTEEGKLYFFHKKISNLSHTSHSLLFIREKSPSAEAYVEDSREAELDLSGIALKVGIKIRL